MALKKWLLQLVKTDNEHCQWKQDFDGINFTFTENQTAAIKNGKASELVLHQFVALQMLVEQGEAESIANGFSVPSLVVVNLDEDSCKILGLPEFWLGNLAADIKGTTGKSTFSVEISASNNGSSYTRGFQVEGPVISFSQEQKYLLTPGQQLLFDALSKHQKSLKSEYDNLCLIHGLQKAQSMGADLSLGHFDKLNILAPESISIEAELDEHGRLILTPQMGQAASHQQIEKVLGQLNRETATSLRVGDEIILFDEATLQGVREVLKNRVIPRHEVDNFLKNPTAFIDAGRVNLDLGFSARVKGATRFRHAYFGETDQSGVDWFGKKFGPSDLYSPQKLTDFISDPEQLREFEEHFAEAAKTGAQELEFNGKVFDISNNPLVESALNKVRQQFTDAAINATADEPEEDEDNDESENNVDPEPMVVDIQLNDSDLETPSHVLDKAIDDVLIDDALLDWHNYRRLPFPHQVLGTRWILGLALSESSNSLGGGLLADDMGLGKTFMSLASIEHVYKAYEKAGKAEKPCLVVAPLSLLQNWKDEVEQTFKISPFEDIVILQSDGDLNRFRVGGIETKNQQIEDEGIAEIRYSLKVGSSYGKARLDVPKRLVITTYQTLRDYQFSLCAVDWTMVVFDEAQNTKNPNALQTRAAKGVQADFRLVATGTPVENSLADFWCLMDTACPGYLGSYQSFRENYITPILQAAGDELEHVRAVVGRQLRETVGALMLRRIKEDNLEGLPVKHMFVGMPEDTHWDYLPELESVLQGSQLEAYDAVLSDAENSDDNVVLVALQKLRDVSLHPRLTQGASLDAAGNDSELKVLFRESGKFESLLKVLDAIKERKEKCLIFTINKKLQAFLAIALARQYALPPISIINGDAKAVAKKASSPTRKTMIKDFEARDGFNIIIMSPVAAGVGLTVVGANNVIHLERHWNPAKEAQATDRVYRIGQQKDVNVYVPLVHHPRFQSFDVNLHQLLSRKSQLKDAVVTPEQVMPAPGGMESGQWSPYQRISLNDLGKLSWQQFEALCAEALFHQYNSKSANLTSNGADFGADVVLQTDNDAILIQCKHTTGKSYDGYKAITEVHSAKVHYEKLLGKPVRQLIIATNAIQLAQKTRQAAKQYSVEVLDGRKLGEILENIEVNFLDVTRRLEARRLAV